MDKYGEFLINDLEESIKFFGNKNKQERELWVLREFLSYLPINVNETKMIISDQEPIDAFYGDHGFQIKEVLSIGRKRSKELKDKLNSITDQVEPSELLEPYTPILISLNESLSYVKSELARNRINK
jgi:hypothetical protein